MILRPYQARAVEQTVPRLWEAGKSSVVLVAPTGGGKTVMGCALVQRIIDQVRAVENRIVDKWAEGMVEGDRQQIQAAILELRAWNAKNPNWPITVDDGQLARAVAELQTDRKTRFIKSVPRDVRATVMRMTGAEP